MSYSYLIYELELLLAAPLQAALFTILNMMPAPSGQADKDYTFY
jgi:hypothetical protein